MARSLRFLNRRPVKWLIALAVLVSVGTYLLTLPTCRTDRVVVVDVARGETLIKLTAVSDTDRGERVDVIWEGVGDAGLPIEIPFVSPGEGNFRIEVRHEGREQPVVREFTYLTPHLQKRYYVVVDEEVILNFAESFGGFATPESEGSIFAFLFQAIGYRIIDALACLDGG